MSQSTDPPPGSDAATNDSKRTMGRPLLIFSYAAAVFLPFLGLIVGLLLLIRWRSGHGAAVVLISIAAGVGFILYNSNRGGGEPSSGLPPQVQRQAASFAHCLEKNVEKKNAIHLCRSRSGF